MANKSALNFSYVKEKSVLTSTPALVDKKPKAKQITLLILKQSWKWFKILLFVFLMVMGLWGCFQSMWDPNITTNSNVGSGLEFGYVYGTTGDIRFDLMGGPYQQYHTLSGWTMAYGPFYAFFVWPAAWMVLNFMYATRSWIGGLNALMAIIILLVIIRALSIMVTLRSSFQTEKMSEISGKMSEINAKYKGLKDRQSKMKKQQEISELYKKNNVKPFAAFEQMFITLPIFLIIFRVVTIVRPMKASVLFGIWNFSYTPLNQIFSNFTNLGWTYIFFLALVIPSQFLSMKLPQRWARHRNRSATAVSEKGNKQQKKMNMTQNIFAIVMSLIVAFSATGVGVYWFLNAFFSIGQAYLIHRLILKSRQKKNSFSNTLKRFGI